MEKYMRTKTVKHNCLDCGASGRGDGGTTAAGQVLLDMCPSSTRHNAELLFLIKWIWIILFQSIKSFPVKTNAIRSSGLLLVKANGKRLVLALKVQKMLWYNGATRNLKNEGQDGEVLTPKSKANQVITNNLTPYDGIANFVSTITSLIQIATPSFHPSPKRCLFRIQKLSIKKCFSLFQYNSTSLALLFYFLFFIYSIFFTFL
jgi:hypothetical protein